MAKRKRKAKGSEAELLRQQLKRLRAQNTELKVSRDEAVEALEAIRTGKVEALVIEDPAGPRVFTLEGATHSYRVLIEEMSEGAATLSESGVLLYCNACFARLLGQPIERAMGSTFDAYVPARHRGTFAELIARARTADVREEMSLLAGDVEVPVYLSLSRIVDEGRQVFCMVATDLRAQKKSEALVTAEQAARAALGEAEHRAAQIDAILEALPFPVFFGDTGGITRCNRPALAMFGVASPEQLPASFAERAARMKIRAQRDGEPFDESALPFGRALAGVATSVDGWGTDVASGRDFFFRTNAAPVVSDGRIIGAVAVNIDITDQRSTQEALRVANAQLEEADQRKNQFLAALSHELRNPLAPIRNGVYVLAHAAPGGEQAKRAQAMIARQVEQLAHLVDDLLDVTRITRNKIQLQIQLVEVNALAALCIEDHRSLFERASVELELKLAPQPVHVLADTHRLAQVLGNLLQNAAKFTPAGGHVTLEVSTAAPARAEIRVSDNGVGMDAQMLGRLFQPFAQAEATLDRSKGGLGLGLALIKGLVELQNGSIEAKSRGLGRGAEFVVQLPLQPAPAVEESAPVLPAKVKRRVLIIDDNVDAADSLREMLQIDDHEVEVAYGGREGIARAKELRPDVVLCDIGMPGVDGYEVARTLRSDEALGGVTLVALTGYTQLDDVARTREAGFDDHLAKPPSAARLNAALRQANQSHHSPVRH